MKKTNAKSVRMTDEVFLAIEAYPGVGFNEKFENLVIDYLKSVPEREAYIEALDIRIKKQLCMLNLVSSVLSKVSLIQENIDSLLQLFETKEI